MDGVYDEDDEDLQAALILSKELADIKSTPVSHTSSSASSSSSSSPTKLEQIQTELTRGNTNTLLAQLRQPVKTPVNTAMQGYLQQQALSDILLAKADPKAELKSEQQTQLTQAMEEILRSDPAAVIRSNADGLMPLDVALQHDLPEQVIDRLQQAEQVEHDRQDSLFIQAVQQTPIKPEDKQDRADSVELWGDLDGELKTVRAKLNQSSVAS